MPAPHRGAEARRHDREATFGLVLRTHQIEIWSATEELLARRLPFITEMLARHGIKQVKQIDSDYFFVSERKPA